MTATVEETSSTQTGGTGRVVRVIGPVVDVEFAPDQMPEQFNALLPRYIEARVYSAMLEAAASEQAARQRAMKSASDNADELIKSLTRDANSARQAEITQEIMEIVGGAEALSQGKTQ